MRLARARSRLLPVVWIAGALLLLVFALSDWLGQPEPLTFHPASPLDATSSTLAEEWLFLFQVRAFVPPGSTYTVRAADLSREMTLFMMAYGLLPRASPLPSSYHGTPHRDWGYGARYVLAFPCSAPKRTDLRLVAWNPKGCVFVRQERSPR